MTAASIVITDLCAHYAKTQVLFNIGLVVPRGSFFGLLGANGAGKSTLLNTINTLLTPTSGTLLLEKIDVIRHPIAAKRLLGVVPQEVNLNGFESVRQVLFNQAGYFGIKKIDSEEYCEFLLQKLTLWDKREARIMHLSGGMKRRLMVARALISKPKVLLLDEPTAGVDVDIRRAMWQFIQEINRQGTTVILTTHYLEEAEVLCDRIAVIKKGSIVRTDLKEKVLQSIACQTLLFETRQPITQKDCILSNALNVSQKNTHSMLVTLDNNTSINSVIAELDKKNIEVMSIKYHKNRLEDIVFSHIT